MTNQEQPLTDENYKSILAYETSMAQIITARVLEKPELSAWMILFPILFVPYMQRHSRYKESTKGFVAGFLYTKKIALDVAYKLYKNEISCEEAEGIIAESVRKNPKAEELISNIYHQQIKEIDLLCDHYLALLATEEDKYDQMVRSHYESEDNYLSFVIRLAQMEKEVNRAASATFKEDEVEVPRIMNKMETKLLELRTQEAKQIFNRSER
ncbi:NF038143 family protein [Desulfosporosinus sp.]|uniref:NF038143 family protein n=1 Tax=Desulfosporosinus sp. TaxID=157907 RepID=UPI0025C293BD|nr:NF038143 family protein [Desulfosporosinus sp.]MBC2728368.1 hypothetical protein [Desulfosporosinus sp.]